MADEGQRIRRLEQQVQHRRVIRTERPRERVRIVGDAEPGAKNRLVCRAEGHADARREHGLAHVHAEILWHDADAAHHHRVAVDVVAFEPPIGARGDRKVLPSRPVRDRHLSVRLPLVADIQAVLPVAGRVRLDQLEPPDLVGHAEEERRERVVLIAARSALDLRGAGAEPEPAARAEAVAAADLRLRVIERLVIDVGPGPHVVPPLYPVDVHHGLVLIVASEVRHEGVCRTEVGIRVEIEQRRPAFVGIRPVGAGQVEDVKPLAGAEVRLRAVTVHAHPSEMRVHRQRGRQRVSSAGGDVVRVAIPVARVAAAQRLPLELIAEHGAVLGSEIEHAESSEHVQPAAGIPVHLAVDGGSVQHERRLREVVVRFGDRPVRVAQIRKRNEGDEALDRRIDAIRRYLVVRK